MPAPTKPQHKKTLRGIFARNLKLLMKYAKEHPQDPRWAGKTSAPLGTLEALEARSGVADSALSRYRAEQSAANLDSLEWIGQAFGLQAWALLYPDLDPANPPEVLTPERKEEIKETVRAALKLLGVANEIEGNGGADTRGPHHREVSSTIQKKRRNGHP